MVYDCLEAFGRVGVVRRGGDGRLSRHLGKNGAREVSGLAMTHCVPNERVVVEQLTLSLRKPSSQPTEEPPAPC